jgi:hypothetical protein
MNNQLQFKIPFTGFSWMGFINAFTSVYMFVDGISGDDDYDSKKKRGEPCDGCGNCRNSTDKLQEQRYHMLDTMTGRSSLRCRFDGTPTEMQALIGDSEVCDDELEYTTNFLFGFAGYEYRRVTEDFLTEIKASVDAGKPAIAYLKDTSNTPCRVIIGYDSDALIEPDYTNAQNKPETAVTLDEIAALYVFGEKITPKYTVKDGLERIVRVMEYNEREKLWDDYIERIHWYGGTNGMNSVSPEECAARWKRVNSTMWHTFNTHNFRETFINRVTPELKGKL